VEGNRQAYKININFIIPVVLLLQSHETTIAIIKIAISTNVILTFAAILRTLFLSSLGSTVVEGLIKFNINFSINII